MENIEDMVKIIGRFGNELGNIKDFIGEIELEIKKCTSNLEKELECFKKSLNDSNYSVSKTNEDMFSVDLDPNSKFIIIDKSKENMNETINLTEQVENIREITATHGSSYSISSENNSSIHTPIKIDKNDIKHNGDNNFSESVMEEQWWKEKAEDVGENINWIKEFKERDELKNNLMIKEGWKRTNSTAVELEILLFNCTGKLMPWTVIRKGHAQNGKLLLNVKFERLEDRNKLFSMRKEIAEEGNLSIGEALSHIERKERWIMLTMAERLSKEGKITIFENKRISVDGQWWKYDWIIGWNKIFYNPKFD